MVYIYALIDPDTDIIRYIGATMTPRQRKCSHKHEKVYNKDKIKWYADLATQGKEPVFKILKECMEDWKRWEQIFIDQENNSGNILLNKQRGGLGIGSAFKRKPLIRFPVEFDKPEWTFIESFKQATGTSQQYFIVDAVKRRIADIQALQAINDQQFRIKSIYYTIMKFEDDKWIDMYPDEYFSEEMARNTLVILAESGLSVEYSDSKKYKIEEKPDILLSL